MQINKKKLRREIEENLSNLSETELFTSKEYNDLLSGTISSLLKDTRYKDIALYLINDKDGTACTTGSYIELAYNGSFIKGKKWDKYLAHLGMICHECGHILYTDFQNMNILETELANLSLSKQTQEIRDNASDLYREIYLQKMHTIFNILEDMYIEECLKKEYDGLVIAGLNQVNKEHAKQAEANPFEKMEEFLSNNGCQLDVFAGLLLAYCREFKHSGKMGPLTEKINLNLLNIKDKVDALKEPMYWHKKKALLTEIANAVYEMMPTLTIKKNERPEGSQSSSSIPNTQNINLNICDNPQEGGAQSENSSDSNSQSKPSGSNSSKKNSDQKQDSQQNGGSKPESGDENQNSGEENQNSNNGGQNSQAGGNNAEGSNKTEERNQTGGGESKEESESSKEENQRNGSGFGKQKDENEEKDASSSENSSEAKAEESKEEVKKEDLKREDISIPELPRGIRNNPRKPEEKEKTRTITEEETQKEFEKALEEMAEEKLQNQENEKVREELLKAINPKNLWVNLDIVNTNRSDRNPVRSSVIQSQVSTISKKTARKLENVLKHREEGGYEDGNMLGSKFNSKDVFKNDGKYFSKWGSGDEVPDVVFGLLIDQSGSMNADRRGKTRIDMAKKAAYCLYNVCRELDKPVCINGHGYSGWGNTCQITRYVTFEKDNIDSLADAGANGGTCDAGGLIVTAEEMMKRPEKEKILIVISDGGPNTHAVKWCGNYKGMCGDPNLDEYEAEVNAIAKYYRKQGVKVYGLALDDYDAIRKIYGDQYTIDCSDIQNLPNQMSRIVKKHVLAN